MGIDRSSGIGYGIAIELGTDHEDKLKAAICESYGIESEERSDTIATDEHFSTFYDAGLDVSTEGNSWSGPEFLVFFLKGTRTTVDDHGEGGLKLLTEKASGIHRLNPLMEALEAHKVPFHGSGWISYQSVF